jgi:hypothetical protein
VALPPELSALTITPERHIFDPMGWDAMAELRHSRFARAPVYAPFSAWAAVSASIIAGLVFALLDIGLGWALRGISPWIPMRMIGAIVLGPAVLSQPATFDPTVALVAIFIHLMLSVIYGALLALLMPAVDIAWGILLGGLYGLALYYINFYGFNAFSPWFAEQRDWVSIASHFVFGAVLACAYTAINTRRFTAQTDPAMRSPSQHSS